MNVIESKDLATERRSEVDIKVLSLVLILVNILTKTFCDMKKIQNNFGLHKGRTQPMNREQISQYSINRYVCKDILRDFALKRFTNNIFMKYALLD